MDFLLLYHFGKLKGVAIEILQVLIDDITTNMIFEILAIKFLSEIEKYLAMATLVSHCRFEKNLSFPFPKMPFQNYNFLVAAISA